MSEEKWIEMLNAADPWERSIQKRKEFERSHPREKAIKLLREGRQHYLLNRSTMGIDRLRYRTQIVNDYSTEEAEAKTFELSHFPPESVVGIGLVPPEAQRSQVVQVIEVEWRDGIKTGSLGPLHEWSPHSGGMQVGNLGLAYVPRYPIRSEN